MMSARPRRAISSRTAGVRAVGARRHRTTGDADAVRHATGQRSPVPSARAASARDGPLARLRLRRAGSASSRPCTTVRLKPERPPRPEPRRRPAAGRTCRAGRGRDSPSDRLEDPLPLEQRDVEQRLVVEPERGRRRRRRRRPSTAGAARSRLLDRSAPSRPSRRSRLPNHSWRIVGWRSTARPRRRVGRSPPAPAGPGGSGSRRG